MIETFKNQVVTIWARIVYEVVSTISVARLRTLGSQNKRIGLLANLALKRFPVERVEAVARLYLFFHIEPTLEALKVNIANRA